MLEGNMYDDIINLAENQQYLQELKDPLAQYTTFKIYKELLKSNNDDLKDYEQKLKNEDKLSFKHMFKQPVGKHLFQAYLPFDHVDKAVFLSDVDVYRKLSNVKARRYVAKKIYDRYLQKRTEQTTRKPGLSIFHDERDVMEEEDENDDNDQKFDIEYLSHSSKADGPLKSSTEHDYYQLGENAIGVDDDMLQNIDPYINSDNCNSDLFDTIYNKIRADLKRDQWPLFLKSKYYNMYIRIKMIENSNIDMKGFRRLRKIGKGAFGNVNAVKKKDTGKLYAVKMIDKRRVQATKNMDAIMYERDFLSMMDSKFVTGLKYALQDENNLYIVMDLMTGGDLKYHLNNERIFSLKRSKFYSAQVLLGIEHLHSKNIIYRDLKLENVLMDEKGHCKISDLGLAVNNIQGGVKGYAGTPGYTAPEVVLSHHYYGTIVDFFSLGVMIYRFLCGRKPYQPKRRRRNHEREDPKRRTSELDRNVVEMEPEFPSSYFSPSSKSLIKGLLVKNPKERLGTLNIQDIKDHPWFDNIDFGLLEAGYCNPPFKPPLDELNAEQQTNLGRPPQDEKYTRTKIKPEFDDQLKGFPYHNTLVVQEEIVLVLEKIAQNNRRSSQNGIVTSDIDLDEPQSGGKSCIKNCVML